MTFWETRGVKRRMKNWRWSGRGGVKERRRDRCWGLWGMKTKSIKFSCVCMPGQGPPGPDSWVNNRTLTTKLCSKTSFNHWTWDRCVRMWRLMRKKEELERKTGEKRKRPNRNENSESWRSRQGDRCLTTLSASFPVITVCVSVSVSSLRSHLFLW